MSVWSEIIVISDDEDDDRNDVEFVAVKKRKVVTFAKKFDRDTARALQEVLRKIAFHKTLHDPKLAPYFDEYDEQVLNFYLKKDAKKLFERMGEDLSKSHAIIHGELRALTDPDPELFNFLAKQMDFDNLIYRICRAVYGDDLLQA